MAQKVKTIQFVYDGEETKPNGTLVISLSKYVAPTVKGLDCMYGMGLKTDGTTFRYILRYIKSNPNLSKVHSDPLEPMYYIETSSKLKCYLHEKDFPNFFLSLGSDLQEKKLDSVVADAFLHYYANWKGSKSVTMQQAEQKLFLANWDLPCIAHHAKTVQFVYVWKDAEPHGMLVISKEQYVAPTLSGLDCLFGLGLKTDRTTFRYIVKYIKNSQSLIKVHSDPIGKVYFIETSNKLKRYLPEKDFKTFFVGLGSDLKENKLDSVVADALLHYNEDWRGRKAGALGSGSNYPPGKSDFYLSKE